LDYPDAPPCAATGVPPCNQSIAADNRDVYPDIIRKLVFRPCLSAQITLCRHQSTSSKVILTNNLVFGHFIPQQPDSFGSA
jgi:hypothetical protein